MRGAVVSGHLVIAYNVNISDSNTMSTLTTATAAAAPKRGEELQNHTPPLTATTANSNHSNNALTPPLPSPPVHHLLVRSLFLHSGPGLAAVTAWDSAGPF